MNRLARLLIHNHHSEPVLRSLGDLLADDGPDASVLSVEDLHLLKREGRADVGVENEDLAGRREKEGERR